MRHILAAALVGTALIAGPASLRSAATSELRPAELLDAQQSSRQSSSLERDFAANGKISMDLSAGEYRITGLNNRFHRLILEGSNNRRLGSVVATVVEVPLVWQTFSHYSETDLRRSLAHHTSWWLRWRPATRTGRSQ